MVNCLLQKPHHNGDFKRQMGWIPEEADRFGRVPKVASSASPKIVREFLLAPIERWDPQMPALIRAQFPGLDPKIVKVAQLVQIDLGGDGHTHTLIEARQPPDDVNQRYPLTSRKHLRGQAPFVASVLISNSISLNVSNRQFDANEKRYRRRCQLMNPDNLLVAAGDSFDLSKSANYSVSKTVVTVQDSKLVSTPKGTITIFHIQVVREYGPFIDPFFTLSSPEWKNPDLYVDWIGDDLNADPTGTHKYDPNTARKFDPGTPVEQGEIVRIPVAEKNPDGSRAVEPHWMVARVWNGGNVPANNVLLDFFISDQGGGDADPNKDNSAFTYIGMANAAMSIPAGVTNATTNTILPVFNYAVHQWDVDNSIRLHGHYCIYTSIQNAEPGNNDEGIRGSYDPDPLNNSAQKNVWDFEVGRSSPYPDTNFRYTVKNNRPNDELAWLSMELLSWHLLNTSC